MSGRGRRSEGAHRVALWVPGSEEGGGAMGPCAKYQVPLRPSSRRIATGMGPLRLFSPVYQSSSRFAAGQVSFIRPLHQALCIDPFLPEAA